MRIDPPVDPETRLGEDVPPEVRIVPRVDPGSRLGEDVPPEVRIDPLVDPGSRLGEDVPPEVRIDPSVDPETWIGRDVAPSPRVDPSRAHLPRRTTTTPPAAPSTPKTDEPERPHLHRKGEERQEETTKRGRPLVHPKKVRFETVEEEVVDLETADSVRKPIGNRPARTLEVVEHGSQPHTSQHYTGRIIDVLTDDQGHPYVVQKSQYQGQRPLAKESITPMSERDPEERARVRQGLQKEIAEAEAAAPNTRRRGSGRGGGVSVEIASPAPGIGQIGGRVREGRYSGRTTADRFMRTRKVKARK